MADCLHWDRDQFWVRGRLEGERGPELVASWRRSGATRQVNGKTVAFGDYLGQLAVLSWSARDDRVVDGEPSLRRRLLDQGVVAKKPHEVETLSEFRSVLNAKRRLLGLTDRTAIASLESWNELMARFGHQLARLRSEYVSDLRTAFHDILEDTEVGLRPVDFEYRASPEEGAESIESFRSALNTARNRELTQQRALVGPHRDRLRIVWGGADIARSASAGERKLFGLVLTAARQRVLQAAGREPILLLDDLDAGLDVERLSSVWELFDAAPQVFITSADASTGRGIPGLSAWRLTDARIAPV